MLTESPTALYPMLASVVIELLWKMVLLGCTIEISPFTEGEETFDLSEVLSEASEPTNFPSFYFRFSTLVLYLTSRTKYERIKNIN